MGVCYSHYLVPVDRTYYPTPDAVSRLTMALVDGGFVPATAGPLFGESLDSTACYAQLSWEDRRPFPSPCLAEDIAGLGGRDCKIVWSVDSVKETGLHYPLDPFPEWGDAYYDLELHLAGDFIYGLSEVIEPFASVTCRCGRPLECPWDSDEDDLFGSRIHRTCPGCGRPVRPQEWPAPIRDARTGRITEVLGGLTYQFAILVDCDKGFARESWPIRAKDEFLEMATETFGQDFDEIGDVAG
jgi:hypothetical protein